MVKILKEVTKDLRKETEEEYAYYTIEDIEQDLINELKRRGFKVDHLDIYDGDRRMATDLRLSYPNGSILDGVFYWTYDHDYDKDLNSFLKFAKIPLQYKYSKDVEEKFSRLYAAIRDSIATQKFSAYLNK